MKFLPGRHQIDGFGNGGFRFADMSHRGSLLILPSGMSAWVVADVDKFTVDDVKRFVAEKGQIDLVLLGTGKDMRMPSNSVIKAFADASMAFDFMNTNAAVRTYNVLLAEDRRVAVALIAVG